jgi:Ca2+-binding EF-hand superfamily protein
MKMTGLLLALMLLVIGAVHAADIGFQKIDTNGDGKVDQGELSAAIEKKFKWYDRNGDGVIEAREFNPKNDPRALREFKFMDKDKNRKVDLDEFRAAGLERFKAFDYDRDNAVSAPEYRAKEAYPLLKIYF